MSLFHVFHCAPFLDAMNVWLGVSPRSLGLLRRVSDYDNGATVCQSLQVFFGLLRYSLRYTHMLSTLSSFLPAAFAERPDKLDDARRQQNYDRTYAHASFQSAGLDASLFYGNSITATLAFEELGRDVVGIPGLSIRTQFFAAINDTNTTLQTGSAGIVGMGFLCSMGTIKSHFLTYLQPPLKRLNLNSPNFPHLQSLLSGSHNMLLMSRDIPYAPDLRRTRFPDLASLLPSHQTSKRQSTTSPSLDDLLNSFASDDPLGVHFRALTIDVFVGEEPGVKVTAGG
ncbi:hypothetical protein JB92DRAFT_3103357 [Gautieria morchelliformis]|nr:hypothetical protein JB92DRAFT_3103357 [Gautieria morchelliformis]